MIRRIRTHYSVYEVDEDNKQVRRVYGENAATEYVGQEGVWRTYHSCAVVNGRLTIIWGYNPDKGAVETTVSSPVVGSHLVETTPGRSTRELDS